MNLFNKAIYKNHLEHTAEGTKWGKHKYLYITETGRYVYPEDIAKGKSPQDYRRRQINDQIKSAHVGSTTAPKRNLAGTSGRDVSPTGKNVYWKTDSQGRNRAMSSYAAEIKRNNTVSAPKKQEADKTSGVAAGSKSVASNPTTRNTITIKKTETTASKPTTTATAKTEEKKTETTTTNTGEKYKNMSEETKQWLMKNAGKDEKKEGTKSGKKGGSGKKKSSGSKKSSTKDSAKATKTEEQKQMGLSDDDLKKMEVNTQATDREEVLKNIALRVIRGDYGNGADRKAKLGNYYDEVQKRVNELMKSGNIQREGQSQTEKKDTTSSSASTSKSSTDSKKETTNKTETQKENAEEIQVAKQLAEMSGMKNSATLNLIKLYKSDSNSKKFKEELKILSEGDEKEAKKMLQVLGRMKHSDLEEGLFLKHFGTKRHSGRFPFGSGARPYQHGGGPSNKRRNSTFGERRSMSDEDLETAINRARKEGELQRLERDNRSQGQKFTEDVLTSIGKTVLTKAATGALLWAGKKFASEVLNDEELGTFIANGGPEKKKK